MAHRSRGTRASLVVISVLTVIGARATALHAQSGDAIARRIAAAPDGEVRLTYATRDDVCGDGRGMINIGPHQQYFSSDSRGGWNRATCARGLARVSVVIRDREIVQIRPRVGGEWGQSGTTVTDLGRVSAPDAAAYFMSLASRAGERSYPDPLLSAAIADSVRLAPSMLAMARNASLSRETRKRATHWTGVLGDASMVAPLVVLAQAGAENDHVSADDPGPGDKLTSAAVAALSMMSDGIGMPALTDLARHGAIAVRKAAVFWLGQSDEPQPRAVVRDIAADEREPEALRGAAIFALGTGSTPTAKEREFLRGLFASLTSERLQERVLMALSQREDGDDTRWMLGQARDARFPLGVRKKAVFWAGQGHARIDDLTALYRDVSDERLREHVVFVLSQRDDEQAIQALIGIARGDDRAMRQKALFWLAQKDDPRVTKLISDLVTR